MKKRSAIVTIVFYFAILSQLVSLGVHADATTNAFTPDHYLSYEFKSLSLTTHDVQLRDRFIGWTKFVVERPIKLLNPTLKRHNNNVFPITDEKLHYTAFELHHDANLLIDRPALITNQFGTFTVKEFRPSRLLVPSRKKIIGLFDYSIDDIITNNAPIGDHYLCYDIPPVEVDGGFGYLKDQFRERSFDKLVARRFCNPVAKVHKSEIFEVINDVQSNHLMCFDIESKGILKLIALLSQFGLYKAFITRDEELCVPSNKIELPIACKGSSPEDDGTCNGVCENPNENCSLDPTANSCACFPNSTLCIDQIPDSDGVCNGLCPNPADMCLTDASGLCRCLSQEPLACRLSSPDQAS